MTTKNEAYKIGHITKVEKVFTEQDVITFAALTGDTNPIHLDENYAKSTRFGQKIVHGMLVASQFSMILGTIFPGIGTIYLGQTLNFKSPAYLDTTIIFSIELVNMRTDKPIATFRTICNNENGDTIIEGEATVILP